MNVLFLTHHFPTPDEPGAPRPWKIAEYLQRRGHNVTVVTAGVQYMTGEQPDKLKYRPWIREEVEGITVWKTYALSDYRRSFSRRIASYLLFSLLSVYIGLRIPRPDVILTGTGVPPTVSMSGWVVSLIRRTNFVVEDRELYPEAADELGLVDPTLVLETWYRYHRFMRERADQIIALTPGIRRLLLEKGVDESKIETVTNAFDPITSPAEPDAIRNSTLTMEQLSQNFLILYTGGLGQANGLMTLLRATNQLRENDDLLFLFIGDGDEKARYEKYCRDNGITNCTFLPAVPRDELPAYFEHADVTVHLTPSGEIWKGMLANKVFDYLGHGCPMIFAGAGDTAQLLRDSDAGIIAEPENPNELAEAILMLYNNPDLVEEMGSNARKYMEENYSRERKLEKLERVLKSTQDD